jgi:hypothetical protein
MSARVGVSLLSLLLAAPVRAAPRCHDERVVHADLATWRTRLRTARTDDALAALLRELHLPPLSSGKLGCADSTAKIDGVDLFSAQLSAQPVKDRIVQVRARCSSSAGQRLIVLRIQVLRPLDEGRHCALGADLSMELADDGDERPPRTFSFVHVIDPRQSTIEVRDVRGPLSGWEQEERLSLWSAAGDQLVKIFERPVRLSGTMTHSNEYRMSATVRPVGRYPRELRVRRVEEVSGLHGDCFSSVDVTVEHWRFDGRSYELTTEETR